MTVPEPTIEYRLAAVEQAVRRIDAVRDSDSASLDRYGEKQRELRLALEALQAQINERVLPRVGKAEADITEMKGRVDVTERIEEVLKGNAEYGVKGLATMVIGLNDRVTAIEMAGAEMKETLKSVAGAVKQIDEIFRWALPFIGVMSLALVVMLGLLIVTLARGGI